MTDMMLVEAEQESNAPSESSWINCNINRMNLVNLTFRGRKKGRMKYVLPVLDSSCHPRPCKQCNSCKRCDHETKNSIVYARSGWPSSAGSLAAHGMQWVC